MTIMQQIFQLAERTAEPAPVYWVAVPPSCQRCRERKVLLDGDTCDFCQQEIAQGYEALTMTGRCANGCQRDSGILYHAVKLGEVRAVCGAKHGKRSRWSEYHGEAVTCPRCNKKLGKEN